MFIQVALTVAFLWAVSLVVVGWLVSRRAERLAFHFWFGLVAAEAFRWFLTIFLVQNVGRPLYLTSRLVPYSPGGLYGAMGVAGVVLLVGGFFWLRERRFWPGGYHVLSSVLVLGALLILWLLFI